MSLPPGARVLERVGGGDINEAYRVKLAGGEEAFVKTRAGAGEGEYAVEAAGLRWLGEARGLRVPAVLALAPGHLALEWVGGGRLDAAGEEELGRGLAITHAAGAERFGDPGGCPTWGFDWLRVPNRPGDRWARFYGGRLFALMRSGRERGVLSAEVGAAVERVCEGLEELVGEPEAPARLHGDLWAGNVLADASGRPWLIDPAVYGGHREVDLAMLHLFGAPAARMLGAYEEHTPLGDGWRERVELYQLLPLLVHALLFGGGYVARVHDVARRYGG